MKPVPFVGGMYESRSVAADHQRCVNFYVEADGNNKMLVGTPGLVLEYALPNGPVRGAGKLNDRVFFVGGNRLYETTSGSPVELGLLSSNTGRVSVAANDTQQLLVDGVAGYVYDGSTFSTISDPDFPNGVSLALWEGNFFIVGAFLPVTEPDSKEFWISALGDGDTWDGLDFASAENKPETIVSMAILHDRLMLFSHTGSEEWSNTGAAEFAFERDNGASIEVGCEARDSVVTMNNGAYWLGRDRDGDGMVFAMQGGIPQRISTHAIEHLFQSIDDRSDAYAFAYQQEGHSFYCLTIPGLDRTFCYDAATQLWHERATWDSENAVFKAWRPLTHVLAGKHLVGDAAGNVYSLSLEALTDGGNTLRRERTTTVMASNLARQFFGLFQLDCEVGYGPGNPQVMLSYSDDGGLTWSQERVQSLGAPGHTMQRVLFPRCGMGRKRVWKVAITDAYRPAIFGAYVDAQLEAA